MTHLFQALLTNGFGVDLYLEDDGISLTNETPHLVKLYPMRFVHAPFCSVKLATRFRLGVTNQQTKTHVHTTFGTRVYNDLLLGFAAGRRPALLDTFLIITDLKRVPVHSCHSILTRDFVH